MEIITTAIVSLACFGLFIFAKRRIIETNEAKEKHTQRFIDHGC